MTKKSKMIVGVLILVVVLYMLNKKGYLGTGETKAGAFGRRGQRKMGTVTSYPNISTPSGMIVPCPSPYPAGSCEKQCQGIGVWHPTGGYGYGGCEKLVRN